MSGGKDDEGPNPSPESASLVRRLAGPSTGKAGLAKDQTEINRIIAEASKGSKFYENEKKKDKDTTERIERLLKEREEALIGVDIHKVEEAVDRLLAELEAGRDLTQTVVHVDMDAFYANVELLDNPDLEGKPFAVVGGGVLTTASYEARKYGVRSGMPGFIAKKLCPSLIFVSIHFPRYSEMSKKVMDVFHKYDPNMQVAGCDEGYLNITKYCDEHSIDVADCVQRMRAEVFEQTNLTASAGIAPNKMLAKICSDKNKPNGQYHLLFTSSAIREFMRDLPIRKIPGIGRVNERLLDSIGIKTCGDIFEHRATLSLMDKRFGLHSMLRVYLGIASNVVAPGQREERKSIGSERTFDTIDEKDKILKKLDEIAAELESDMTDGGWAGRTVTLKYKLDTFQSFSRAKSLPRLISSKEDLFAIGKELLMAEWPLKLRLIGLRVTKLKDLKAPESDDGIKRFFKPVSRGAAPTSDESPRKRRRISEEDGEADAGELVSYIDLEDVESEDEHSKFTMAEQPYEDDALGPGALDGDIALPSGATLMKPTSTAKMKRAPLDPTIEANASAAQPKQPSASVSTSNQLVPSSSRLDPPARAAKPVCTCPVCGKTMEADNDELNAHIDFCLSKGAIQEAQVNAVPGTSSSGGAHSPAAMAKPASASAARWNGLFRPGSDAHGAVSEDTRLKPGGRKRGRHKRE